MVGFYFWLVIFVFKGFVSCQRVNPPSRTNSAPPKEDVRDCYEDLLTDSDISHLLLDVTSPEKIDHFCGRISRLKQCIANNEHQLSNEENTNYLQKIRGISSFYLNVCPPGTDITTQYKGNAPCFESIKNKILSCGSDLPDLSSYQMQSDLKARCCALSRHRICSLEAAGENCGRPAAEVMDQILQRYFKHDLIGCPSEIKRACLYDFSESSVTSEDYDDDDYTTKGSKDLHTITEDYEEDTHNSGNVPVLTFLSSLFVVLLQLF